MYVQNSYHIINIGQITAFLCLSISLGVFALLSLVLTQPSIIREWCALLFPFQSSKNMLDVMVNMPPMGVGSMGPWHIPPLAVESSPLASDTASPPAGTPEQVLSLADSTCDSTQSLRVLFAGSNELAASDDEGNFRVAV